jgi:hypothetical protein
MFGWLAGVVTAVAALVISMTALLEGW